MELYLILFLSGFCAISISGLAYFAFKFYKGLRNQITLSLKSQHMSVRELRSLGYKVERISNITQESIDEQRKSFEHQRVLMNSLGRQLKLLDAMAMSSPKSNKHVAENKIKRSKPVKIEKEKTAPAPEAQSQASLLTQLFQSKNNASTFNEAEPQKIQRLSDLFAQGEFGQTGAVNVEERRVSNG